MAKTFKSADLKGIDRGLAMPPTQLIVIRLELVITFIMSKTSDAMNGCFFDGMY